MRDHREDPKRIEKTSSDIAVIDPQSGHVMTISSLQTTADYIMSVHVPSSTVEFAARVDAALRRAHARNHGVDLLNENGHRPGGGPQTDPALTRDRALLKRNSGGACIRPISDRPHAPNSMCLVQPLACRHARQRRKREAWLLQRPQRRPRRGLLRRGPRGQTLGCLSEQS